MWYEVFLYQIHPAMMLTSTQTQKLQSYVADGLQFLEPETKTNLTFSQVFLLESRLIDPGSKATSSFKALVKNEMMPRHGDTCPESNQYRKAMQSDNKFRASGNSLVRSCL